jgi:hypothetical protein
MMSYGADLTNLNREFLSYGGSGQLKHWRLDEERRRSKIRVPPIEGEALRTGTQRQNRGAKLPKDEKGLAERLAKISMRWVIEPGVPLSRTLD